jgi:hypothetical protein
MKFSYDEPLTLRYAEPRYKLRDAEGKGGQERSEEVYLSRWSLTAISAAMGFSPTRIKFPVPAAELAGSFHFEISASPEVPIIKSVLLAGRPQPEPMPAPTPPAMGAAHQRPECALMKTRERRRPSFDAISGGYPTVDLHVADVPYGSRSRAQVGVEASATGWFATAVFSSWLGSGILGFAAFAKPQPGVGSTLLMLATFTAVLALAAAVIMASSNLGSDYSWRDRFRPNRSNHHGSITGHGRTGAQ